VWQWCWLCDDDLATSIYRETLLELLHFQDKVWVPWTLTEHIP
jgi:hypothetical protein